MSLATTDLPNAIAIVGMAGRFPGADNIAEFWANIRAGVCSITHFSRDELLAAGADPAQIDHPAFVPARGVISDHDRFDAAFFGYSPREVEVLDPQQRLLLEVSWQALEHAGYVPETINGPVGVFAGVGVNTYILSNIIAQRDISNSMGDLQVVLGNDKDYVTTRVSYKLNLSGPSVNVQTACSTSLVATHLACQSLISHECDMALAGGSTVRTPHTAGYMYEQGGIMAPDGVCRPFDAKAQGTVSGNGAGVVVLKRLADALADGDTIFAVIRASAINNDGANKIGYTAPSVRGQSQVITDALELAGVPVESIGYIEAHGTATPLGDPIEITALTRAFGPRTAATGFCALGALKANMGHLDAAAGVAGLIKTVLALHHRELPPSIHYEAPNPEIDFASSPFYVNTTLTPWPAPADGEPRRAGVSSFGIGGTNAHVILEEAPVEPTPPADELGASELLVLSGRVESSLDAAAANLRLWIEEHPEAPLADVAWTLQRGRRAFGFRQVIQARNAREASAALAGADGVWQMRGHAARLERGTIWMFPGQGAQYPGMAAALYTSQATFAKFIDRGAAVLEPILGRDIRDLIFAEGTAKAEAEALLQQTQFTQPALFLVEYALARMLGAWGLRPEAMIGHSIGEYVAACLAGVFAFEDALRLVAARGALMADVEPGAMLAVPLAPSQIAADLPPEVALAAHNTPDSCVVAGPFAAIDALEARWSTAGHAVRRLHTSHAFHSPMLEPILAAFHDYVAECPLKGPKLPFVSNVTGTWISAEEATDPAYWVRHLRQTVRMAEGLATILGGSDAVLLEVGPGRAMTTFARRSDAFAQQRHSAVQLLPHPQEDVAADVFVQRTLAQLWLAGVDLNWAKIAGPGRRRIPLPTTPFERQRYWVEPGAQTTQRSAVRRSELEAWLTTPRWQRISRLATAQPTGTWALLGADPALDELAAALAPTARVVRVRPGERLSGGGADWTVDLLARDQLGQVLEQLAPDHIVHGGMLTATTPLEGQTALQALVALAQALARNPATPVTVLTRGACAVTGDEMLIPAQALGLALAVVVPQEFPQAHWRTIDLPTTIPARGMAALIGELAQPEAPTTAALRGATLWEIDQQPYPLPQAAELPLPSGAVVVITGGLGGMGLSFAKALARDAQARVALLSRTQLPERDAWDHWRNTHAADDRISGIIAELQQIEQLGGAVLPLQVDISDYAALASALATVRETWGPVDAAIHAAGVGGGGIIQMLDAERLAATLAPKVQGTLALLDALEHDPVRALVLCSSVRSVIGGPGRVDYVAANLFLDAVAHERRALGAPIVTINWDTWQDVGMSVEAARALSLDAALETADGMTPAQGCEILRRSLTSPEPQIVVSTRDLAVRIDEERQAAQALLHAQLAPSRPRHPRPALATPYLAPRNPTEEQLAQIWGELLGIDAVGVEDNFFELGGDSVVSIQMIARANQSGLQIAPRQIFEHQTIAGLAAVAGSGPTISAEQGLVDGPLPLTPIQRWFFEQELADLHHWNQAVVLAAAERLDEPTLQQALDRLLVQHDALRLRFAHEEGAWSASHAPLEASTPVPLAVHTLDGDAARTEALAATHAGLDITQGPVFRAAILRGSAADELLLVAHHLVVDGYAWRVLVEDLWTIYFQLRQGQAVQLPPKTSALKAWAERLADHAASEEIATAAAHWAALPAPQPLPLDRSDMAANTVATVETLTTTLDPEATSALLQPVHQAYNTQINDVLLTALGEAICAWTGGSTLLLDLEGHGREPFANDLDVSRTVGWFTTIFPVALQLPAEPSPGERLKAVKEQLRSLPANGFPFGVARYLSPDAALRAQLAALPQAELSFLYLGQFDESQSGDLDQGSGPPQGGANQRHYPLEVSAFVLDGRLHVQWRYSHALHDALTIAARAEGYMAALRRIIDHCTAQEEPSYTPSDFPLARIDQPDLDALLAQLREL